MAQALSGRTRSGAWARAAAWTFHIVLPALVLWLLIARPELDLRWENHAAHFGLVLGTALLNVVLGLLMAGAAGRRSDPRLLLVAWAFLLAAGFLGLHALATPEVLVEQPNAGFVLATPVGLCVGGLLALASGVDWSPTAAARLIRMRWVLTAVLLAAIAGWAVVSLAGWPPLDEPLPPEEARGPLVGLAFGGTALYGFAAYRYLGVHRRRPAVVLLSLVTAFALLALAMFAIAYGRNWQASWWEWHLLMGVAFGFVAYSAYVQFQREGSASGLFDSITLEQTVESIRRDHRAALEELVAAMDAEREAGTSTNLGRAASPAGRSLRPDRAAGGRARARRRGARRRAGTGPPARWVGRHRPRGKRHPVRGLPSWRGPSPWAAPRSGARTWRWASSATESPSSSTGRTPPTTVSGARRWHR